ncbi:MAG: CotH kinase family protein [Crocinitomicaceae bacterium]|nr:CotH kinase family protein [Crocinitomicaceae bacterium]
MKSILALFFLLIIHVSYGQVVINEYSCSNSNGILDAFGDRSDWIELHNIGASAVDISGFFLSDNASNLSKWEIPAGVSVPAGGYQMVFCSKRDQLIAGELHTSFGLTQTLNEWIILSTAGGSIVDSLKITHLTQKDHSYGRTTNGALTWSIFTTPTPNAANSGGVNYYTAKPTMNVAAGFYSGSQTVSLATTDASATIYYTTDGTTPTTASTVYSAPINISSTSVLRAKSFSSTPNVPPSFVETNTYFIGVNHTLPVLSVCGDQVTDFLNDVAPGAFSNNFDGAFELFEDNGTLVSEGEGYYNKHGNDSWAYDQRGFDMVVKDEYGYTNAVRHPVFPAKNRDEYQKLIVKAAANDNYPFSNGGAHIRDAMVHTLSQLADLRMDERTSRFGVVYVDGEYWGVYDIREKVDDADFTDHYYNQDKFNIAFLKTWGATWAEYGGAPAINEWDTLKNYIVNGDMTDPVQYNNVKAVYNTGSLIDYVVLNSYVVTSDWLNWNTGWWHGHIPPPQADKQKWRYILWDNDASWGHYINYTGIPSTNPDADPCNPEALPDPGGQGHIPILNKLFLNAEFQQEYITRYADLMNTYFSCDYMNHLLDSMVGVIQPEMPDQIAKWGGNISTWQQNVQDLRDFIDQRCLAMTQGMVDCYNLTGPFDLTVKVEPPGSGEIKLNSLWTPYYPWTGQFYGNINTLFKASANTGFVFDHWESVNHVFLNPTSTEDTLNLLMADTVIAYFVDTTTTVVNPPPPPPGPNPQNPAGFVGFHIPNAFSPNADNSNDLFEFFVGWDITSFNIKLFDRWGNVVFETETIGDFWDGYYKGKLVNTGVYTYVLVYESSETGSTKKTGNVTVLR